MAGVSRCTGVRAGLVRCVCRGSCCSSNCRVHAGLKSLAGRLSACMRPVYPFQSLGVFVLASLTKPTLPTLPKYAGVFLVLFRDRWSFSVAVPTFITVLAVTLRKKLAWTLGPWLYCCWPWYRQRNGCREGEQRRERRGKPRCSRWCSWWYSHGSKHWKPW